MPDGFRYASDVIDAAEEARLVRAFADLPFKEFEFHGFLGKRRVVSFGHRYDFNSGALKQAEAEQTSRLMALLFISGGFF